MALIFGLDIGTTSIGFAVIDHDPEQRTGEIRRLGVRIFPEARDPKALVPLNQGRRAARMRRRQLRRRRQRRHGLGELLHRYGFLPKRDSPEWNRVMQADPYQLRKWAFNLLQRAESDGLHSQVLAAMEAEQANLPERTFADGHLSPHAVGRAIYHLAQRRHFKQRDIDEISEDAETNTQSKSDDQDADEQKAQSAREKTVQALEQEHKTLGAWLAEREPDERKRGIHALRQNVEEEFDQVWAAYLPNDQIRAEVRRAIFDQRPVFWRLKTLGTCPFLPEKKGRDLCPRGSWLSQQRRMLEKLNNLQLVRPEQRCLDSEERQAILDKLQTQASMTWAGVRRALAPLYRKRNQPGDEKLLKFNLEEGGEKKLLGNVIEAKLADIFGEAWPDHPHQQAIRDTVPEKLWKADYGEIGERVIIRSAQERREYRDQAARYFIETFGVSHEQAEAIKNLKLPTGWEPYSSEALRRILPLLEAGVRFGEIINGPDLASWRDATFPNHQEKTSHGCDRLPSPADEQERKHVASLRNPTVARTRNELRKVVNNLIDKFGKPDLIRVELARDVGLSKREREEMQTGMKRQEKRRKAARKNLQERGISEPSRDHIEKWMLWEECGHQCPYTGDHICFEGSNFRITNLKLNISGHVPAL